MAIIIGRAALFLIHLQEARGPLTRPRSKEEEVLGDSGPTHSYQVRLSQWAGYPVGAVVLKFRELLGVGWPSETPLLELTTQSTGGIVEEGHTASEIDPE